MPRTLPPDVGEALQAREEKRPHRLTGFAYMSTFVTGGLERRRVPDSSVVVSEDRESGSKATVACVCGHSPTVGLGEYPVKCECSRSFFFDGTCVWALNGPSAPTSG